MDIQEEAKIPNSSQQQVSVQIDESRKQAVYHASRTIDFALIHTRLDVSFDWEKALVFGEATITASPKFFPQDQLILDAKGMLIHRVYHDNQAFDYEYNGEKLTISLGKTYLKSDTLVLTVAYTAQPDARPEGGSQAITSDKGLYFINPRGENPSKMPQIWTQGETESNSVWFPTIDSPNQKMSQDVFITVDEKYTTLSNGILLESISKPNQQRTDHWQQKLPHAPYLTMLGIGEFVVVKDAWKRSDGAEIPVHYYVEPEWEEEAALIFGNTPEMLTFFSNLVGFEYPWDKYHQIIVREYVSGAMENTGAVIFMDLLYSTEGDLVDQNWDDIIAHELSHHWFGDLATCESWSNLPMNESFATYFEVLWDEYKHGKDAAAYHLQSDKDAYFRTVKESANHHDLIWFDYDDKEQMFDGHSYSKGACILHMLRQILGDDAFFAGIQHYLHQHQYSTVEAHDLRLAFEFVTGLDLNWFFNQWFFAKGHPILAVNHKQIDDSLFVTVRQKQNFEEFPLYRVPSKIRIWDASGIRDLNIQIENEVHTFAFAVQGQVENFLIDPENHLLVEWILEKPTEFWAHQFNNSAHYYWVKKALTHLIALDSEKYADLIFSGFEDSFFDVRLEAINQSNRIRKTHGEYLQKKLIDAIQNDEHPKVRLSALSFLLDQFPKHTELTALAQDVIKNDKSNACKSKAMQILGRLNPELGLSIIQGFEQDKSSTIKTALTGFYAEHGDESVFDFFDNTMKSSCLKGQDRMTAMMHLGRFMMRHQNLDLRKKSHVLLLQFHDGQGYEALVLNYILNQFAMQVSQEINAINEEIEAYEQAKDFVWSQRLKERRTGLIELLDVVLSQK